MKKDTCTPPGLFLNFFRWYCHPSLRNSIEGDLLELYGERCKASGKWTADRKFIIDVLLLFRPGIIRPVSNLTPSNPYAMYYHYLKTGMRNLLKYKVFSGINVFGLAIAMAVCMLIILMLADQKAYDQFHDKKDRIYRILADQPDYKSPYATTPYPLASTLKTEYQGIEQATQLFGIAGDLTGNQHTAEVRGYFADAAFFQVFSFGLEKGNPANALAGPQSIVLTHAYAESLFGTEDPIGKTVEFFDRNSLGGKPVSWGEYTVTGVIDQQYYRSHLKFDVLIAAASRKALQDDHRIGDLTGNWDDHFQCYTYVLLPPGQDQRHLEAALKSLAVRQYHNIPEHKDFMFRGQKLTEITPGILTGNEMFYAVPRVAYYFLGGFAFLIMISACLNYISLATARALTRAREIGVRKVTGAYRRNLVMQFLSESVLTALLALVMAIALLVFIKPAFKGLWVNRYLDFQLSSSPEVYGAFIVFAILVGITAGLYPALRLSAFRPVQAIKSTEGLRQGRWGVKKALNVSQFVISMFFVITSVLVYNQFKHFLAFDYGFKAENIVNVSLQGNDYPKMAAAMRMVPGTSTISASDIVPATGASNGIGLRKPGSSDEHTKLSIILADENFTTNLGIPLIAGRNLPPEAEGGDRFVIVNEAAIARLGYTHAADAIGKEWEADWNRGTVQIVGVVKDFSARGPMQEDKIGPLLIRNQPTAFASVQIKIVSAKPMETVARLKAQWERIDPVHSFKYEFYDDQLAAMNQGVFDVVSIMGFLAFLSIVIACLGLLGMVIYTAEQKKKEIGIRRILGAEDLRIAILLSGEFFAILGVAIFIGTPLSYSVNNLWLQKLPNHVNFSWQIITLALSCLLVPALITITTQTFRTLRQNPAAVLRSE